MEEKVGMDLEATMAKFFSGLKFRLEIFRDAKRRLDVYLASEFSVFKYISPDENRLSDIIADLLNPKGGHGQGEVFLKEFLTMVKMNIDCSGACNVSREKTTDYHFESQRRIDILVDINGNFGLAIENKPWVNDHERQIEIYHEYLKNRYKDNYLLVYLSGRGNEPSNLPPEKVQELKDNKRLKVMSYRDDFRNWLEACYKESKAEKVRWFLRDFIDYVEDSFEFESIGKDDKA